MKRFRIFLAVAAVLVCGSGCSGIMGALRPDLDDTMGMDSGPTVGGRWAERGFLSESMPEGGDRYDSVGHSERAPASMRSSLNGDDSWVDPDRAYQNQRDEARDDGNAVSFDNTPNLPPPTRRQYKNGYRATRADFVDDSANEGSLWASDGQTNYYFTKNKIRGVGDIVTLKLEDSIIKDTGLEVRRTLNEREKDAELVLAKERAKARVAAASGTKDEVASSQAAPGRSPASAVGTEEKKETKEEINPDITPGDVDVSQSLDLKAGDTMMAEIVERYPNGNYKIRGSKRVNYRNGSPRLVNLVGIVRGADIGEDDSVASGKLYEYRLEAIR